MTNNRLTVSFLLMTILLGIHSGRIAMWKNQDPEPIRVFPYSVATLPPQLREALQKGITIDSEEDLQQLLENFLS